MKLFDNQRIKQDTKSLRAGISDKYSQYHRSDPLQFPNVEYNTNRANYEPLRNSFEQEFYVVRGLDRFSPTIHIPSTNTLALIYTNDSYAPSRKILNTCLSYAGGPTQFVASPAVPTSAQPQRPAAKTVNRRLAAGLIGVLTFSALLFIGWRLLMPAASGMVIIRPAHRSTVPQEVIVEGRVANAETVWIIVRPTTAPIYYVQPPGKVQNNGSWIGVSYIGGLDHKFEGLTYQIRAVVNPTEELHSRYILSSWPEAELSSEIVEVIRGPKQD